MKSTEPYHLEEGEVVNKVSVGEPWKDHLSIPRNEAAPCLTKHTRCPPLGDGRGRVRNARPPAPLARPAPTGFSASARDGPGREHTNNHSGAICAKRKEEAPEAVRTRQHGNLTRLSATDILALVIDEERSEMRYLVKGTPAWAPRPTQPPPPASCCPTAGGAGGGRRGEQIGRPCPLARLAENTLPQGHFARRVVAPPSPGPPWLGSSCPRPPALKRTPCRAVASADRGLARIGTPEAAPFKTDRAQVPWNGAPERVTAPLVPDPVATARRCRRSRVVWECSPNRAGSGWGRAMRLGRERDGREPVRRRLGRRPTLVTGDLQARRMIPPAIRRLCDRGGWRYDHDARPRGTCALWRRASGLPIRPALKHGPRSLTCVRSQRATKPVRRKGS
ncbi:hypothetical protein H6P81_021374 [Aristolochia fimbriata]|uniref:Uncharacterized protein n=1 Tax=Aristolochia fimbriata TaxID=158543 RepID=A0AAV7DRP0_ARIFI|nr:hypothetical protein H6P81_021374 [Aristolochia fimbriata]